MLIVCLYKSFYIFVETIYLTNKLLALMSKLCPMCGKSKTDEKLFCPECTEKLNSEYEVSIPDSENSPAESVDENEIEETHAIVVIDENTQNVERLEHNDEIADAKQEQTEEVNEEPASAQPIATPGLDKKAWKKQRKDKYSESDKTYYDIERDKKTNKIRFTIISLLLLVLVVVAGLYIYNKGVKGDNLQRSKWEMAQRENTVDSYLTYMDEFPQGIYVDEAHQQMLSLKKDETELFQNLMTSENTIEFTHFIEQYPESPYGRKVKSRFDSLMWQSSLKENSIEGYADYINKSTGGEISGDYIGEAEKRFKMLEQSTAIDEAVLEQIKESINGFFVGLSNLSHTTLSDYLAPTVLRFNNFTNIPSDKMIGQLLLLAAKADAKSLRYEPEISKLQYEPMGSGTYNVNIPLQKIFEAENGGTNQIKGYIIHLKLDPNFKIYSFYESKPFSTAP